MEGNKNGFGDVIHLSIYRRRAGRTVESGAVDWSVVLERRLQKQGTPASMCADRVVFCVVGLGRTRLARL